MNKSQFREWTKNEIIYLDGATGSNLIKAGMPTGVCPEKWILEHREVLLDLQKAYVEAGTHILYAPTFSCNRLKMTGYGLQDQVAAYNRELVALSKSVAKEGVLVAGDLTMTGEQLAPMGSLDFEELVTVYKEQIQAMVEGGADLLVVETMMSLQETRAAVIAAKEVCDLPIMATMTFEKDGRTLYGTDALTAAVVLESLGVDAVGANCSSGPAQMCDLIRTMAEAVSIPIIAKPNAGLPFVDQAGDTCYDMDADTFAEEMALLRDAGASILGGCCGTTPEYIRKLADKVGSKRIFIEKEDRQIWHLASERQTIAFGLNDPFLVVGERINPTGKKKLQASLREGDLTLVREFAEEQEACGARVLDVNMGMSGIDEKAMMLKAMEEISEVTNLPLSLDSSHVEVLEAALRRYPGRALVNSVSCEEKKITELLPVVKKYGAMFILLPLSEKGLPENQEEKEQYINTVFEAAKKLGMGKTDLVIDGLVNTIGANKNAGLEVLSTIRNCKENGFATICGLSNISFGMPERSFVNAAFLTMAIREGLTMAIVNPSQELLMGCAYASDLLQAKETSDMRYINGVNFLKERREAQAAKEVKTPVQTPALGDDKSVAEASADVLDPMEEKLREAVLKGNRSHIVAFTKEALEAGKDPRDLLDKALLPAINLVGEYFDKGKYFLPQLIASAEAMKLSIEVLEPLMLQNQKGEELPVVVIATVEGDVHDIGKNLVALMLKNYGFNVIDLGKDVPKETIIEAAREHHAAIIALSALMTTTMKKMGEVVKYAREQKLDVKVMIGGAVVTEEYAVEIGADGYSKDAAEAVRVAMQLIGKN